MADRCPLENKNSYVAAAICVFLLLAVVLVFGQTVRHDFVNYDDDEYVYKNPQVAYGPTVHGIAWAFTSKHAHNWHPLTWLSHMLDCGLYGLAPGGHHLTNVLLHAAAAIFLFLVLRRMTGDLWPSAFVAAVFAVHPLRAESVAWVAERKDVLSGLLFMITLWAYVGYVRRPFSPARYLAVIVLFALGLMAKPMLVTLPFVLLLLDYWPLGRMAREASEDRSISARWPAGNFSAPVRLLLEKAPLLALAGASCAATVWAQSAAIAVNEQMPLSLRLSNAVVSYVAYLGQFFYPAGLAVLYPHPESNLTMWKILGSLSVLAAICGCVFALRRRYPYLLVGWLWYLGMLLPVIGLVQVGSQSMADRYTYLPLIGLNIALAWGVAQLCRSWPYCREACGVASALVLAVLMWCAWRQTSFWRDSATLWTRTLACTSQNYDAHDHLGSALFDIGQFDEAIKQYKEALRWKPDDTNAFNNMGNALVQMGRPGEGIKLFEQALRLQPDLPEAHNNLGNALFQTGQAQEAILHYRKALQLNPDYFKAQYNLAVALAQTGQNQEAIKHYKLALRLNSNVAEIHNNLGAVLVQTGQPREAIEYYRQALALKPEFSDVRYNLGNAYQALGQYQQAAEQYEHALRLKPNDPEAHYNLANALVQTGQTEKAIEHYRQALALKPDFTEVYYNMALVHADLRKSSEAVAAARKALELARSQGQPTLAKQIEDWLNSYRAGLSSSENAPPTSESAPTPP